MISVVFSPYLMRKAREYGARRAKARENDTEFYSRSDLTSLERHIRGVIGEIAFSVASGIPLPKDEGVPDLFDFVLPSGKTVDVKYTKHRKGSLMLDGKTETMPERLCDYYVLTVGDGNVIDVVGFAEGGVLWNNERMHPRIEKMKRFMFQEELEPISTLLRDEGLFEV